MKTYGISVCLGAAGEGLGFDDGIATLCQDLALVNNLSVSGLRRDDYVLTMVLLTCGHELAAL